MALSFNDWVLMKDGDSAPVPGEENQFNITYNLDDFKDLFDTIYVSGGDSSLEDTPGVSFTFVDNKGVSTTVKYSDNAVQTAYDNDASGLTSKNVQDAIDELMEKVDDVDQGVDSFVSSDGSVSNNGTPDNLNLTVVLENVSFDNSGTGLTSNNPQSALEELASIVNADKDGVADTFESENKTIINSGSGDNLDLDVNTLKLINDMNSVDLTTLAKALMNDPAAKAVLDSFYDDNQTVTQGN